jgi:hypothetical protein
VCTGVERIVLGLDDGGEVGERGPQRAEMESTAGEFLEFDGGGGSRSNLGGDFFDGGGEAALVDVEERLLGLADAFEDTFVGDLLFGAAGDLVRDLGAIGLILARIGGDVGEDRELGQVGIVFRVNPGDFRMEGFVAGAGETARFFLLSIYLIYVTMY